MPFEEITRETVAQVHELETKLQTNPTDNETRKALGHLYYDIVDKSLDGICYRFVPSEIELALQMVLASISYGSNFSERELIEAHYRCCLLFHHLGKESDALAQVDEALKLHSAITERHPLAASGIRFFQTRSGTLTQFGHLCSEIDTFLKMRAMSWIPPYTPMFAAPDGKVANRALLNYWREHICVVTDPDLCKRLKPLEHALEYNTYWVRIPGMELRYGHSSFSVVQNEWENQGRAPILKIPERDKTRGREALIKMGVPEGAWFVATHARSMSYSCEQRGAKPHPSRSRDAEIQTYTLAINEITARGGYVIRLGDPTMPKIEQSANVIDYAHSDLREPWLDLFLLAETKFLLGTPSGPPGVTTAFGAPVLFTNVAPVNGYAQSHKDIYLPKIFRSKKTGKNIPFEVGMKEPFKNLFNSDLYEAFDVELVPNSPEELREATIEMIDRLNNTYSSHPDDEKLQQKFRDLAEHYEPRAMVGRIGAAFLRRYADLLTQEPISVMSDAHSYAAVSPVIP